VTILSPIELVALVANKTSAFSFDVTLDRFDGASYRPGETFKLRVKSARAGYLYVLQIDSSGAPALLYPTAGEDNRVPGGRLVEIQPRGAAGGFSVVGPAGTVRVKAIVTGRPIAFSGSLESLQSQRQQGQDQGTNSAQQTQAQPVPFRWHPTQQQQVERLLAQDPLPARAEQLGCNTPEDLLGPFGQDMVMFYIDTRKNKGR
jgi:hypothetical protein